MYEVIADPHCISHSKKLLEYILREGKGATLISCNGTAVSNDPAVIERNFEFIREGSTSRRLKKHTLHIPISLKKGVGEFIEDEHFEQIAKDYMEEMDRKGIKMKDAQYVLVKHEDTQYNHAHLVVNRVRMEDGATIKDNYIYRRSIEAAERVSKKLVRDLEKQLKAAERFEAEPEIEGIEVDRKLSDLEREETELHSIGEDLNKRKKRVGLSRLELAKEERAAKVFASDLQRKEDGIAAREFEVEEIGKVVKEGGVDFEEARQGLKELGGQGDSVELERHYKKVKEQRDAAIRKSSRKSIVGKTNTIRGLTKDLKKAEDGIDVLILGLNAILNLIEDMRRLHTARERYKKHQKELGKKRAEYAATKAQTAEAQAKYTSQAETVKAERKKEVAKTEGERAAYESYQNLHTKKGKGWNRYKVKRYDYKVWREEYNYFLNAERGGYAFGRMLAESTGLSSYKMKGEDTLLLYQKGREKPIRLHAKNLDPLNKRVLRTFLDNEKELSKIEYHNFSNIIYGYANQSENIEQFGLFLQQHFADKAEKLNIKWEGDKIVGFGIVGADGREQGLEQYFKVSKVFDLKDKNLVSYFESKERIKNDEYYTYTRWIKERNLVRSIFIENLNRGKELHIDEVKKSLRKYGLEVGTTGIVNKRSGTKFNFEDIGLYKYIHAKTKEEYLSFKTYKTWQEEKAAKAAKMSREGKVSQTGIRMRDITIERYKGKAGEMLSDWETANAKLVSYERRNAKSAFEKCLNESAGVADFVAELEKLAAEKGYELLLTKSINENIRDISLKKQGVFGKEKIEDVFGKEFKAKSILRYLSNKPEKDTGTYQKYLREIKVINTIIEEGKKETESFMKLAEYLKPYGLNMERESGNIYFENKVSGRRFASSEISYKQTEKRQMKFRRKRGRRF